MGHGQQITNYGVPKLNVFQVIDRTRILCSMSL